MMPMINSRAAAALLNRKTFSGSPILALHRAGASISSSHSKGIKGDERGPYDAFSSKEAAEAESKHENLREKTMDTANKMADRTKEWVNLAVDKGKETAEDVAEAAKIAARKAWETVTSKSSADEDDDMGIEDHVSKPTQDEKKKVMDQEVVDERRRRVESEDQNKY